MFSGQSRESLTVSRKRMCVAYTKKERTTILKTIVQSPSSILAIRVIQVRLASILENYIGDTQYGFRSKRSTAFYEPFSTSMLHFTILKRT